MLPKLDQLNQIESKRQETNLKTINDFSKNLLSTINKNADNFFKDLARTNETLLIKFDDILTEDEILKHGKNSSTLTIYLFLSNNFEKLNRSNC